MPVQLNAVMADELYDQIRGVAREDSRTDLEVIHRALKTYLTLRKEVRRGLVLGFVDIDSKHQLQHEVVGI